MLKPILSVSDVKKLEVGDQLVDNPERSLAKTYIVKNISGNRVYAIHENGHQELKLLKTDEIPHASWWVNLE